MIQSIEVRNHSLKLHARTQLFQAHQPRLDFGESGGEQKIWLRSQSTQALENGFFNRPGLGIIGSRYPSAYGLRFVREFFSVWNVQVPRILRDEVLIYSGGAHGIDLAVHEEALRWRNPTWAWVVGPLQNPNPRSRREVFCSLENAANSGLLTPSCLEPPPLGEAQARPLKSYWLERNRWLVSSCDAIVVVEAHEKSGTWSSVRVAQELGIPVFALGGPYFSTQSQGTNLMISSGYAHPILSVGKLVETLVVEIFSSPYNELRGEAFKVRMT